MREPFTLDVNKIDRFDLNPKMVCFHHEGEVATDRVSRLDPQVSIAGQQCTIDEAIKYVSDHGQVEAYFTKTDAGHCVDLRL